MSGMAVQTYFTFASPVVMTRDLVRLQFLSSDGLFSFSLILLSLSHLFPQYIPFRFFHKGKNSLQLDNSLARLDT